MVQLIGRGFREKRTWQPREMQMLSEWLVRMYPDRRWKTRVRLGTPKPTVPRPEMSVEEQAMIGAWRRWADAIVYPPPDMILVEAAIRPEPGDVSKLELYASLLPHTPELEPYRDAPLTLILLYSIEDPATIYLARQHDIRCIEYKPPWLPAYLETLLPRERRGVRF